MFDMALEALEGVLSQKAARSCLEAGLSVQGKSIDTASLEDYRAALRSNVFRQLQVVMPATAAAQLIREVEFQLEQLDNERNETDARRDGKAVVPQTMVDETKSTAIRDPDLLAMAGSNLLTLNLRSLGSLSVEFGDVLFAERDLKLEVRTMRRTLDEGQHIERDKIENLRDTLRLRRNILLVTQREQLGTLDHQIRELSQRIVVPRELEARLDSAHRLLASGTLATSDLRQMERLVENVAGAPHDQVAVASHGSGEIAPELTLSPEPAALEPIISEPASMLAAEVTSVFASEAQIEPEAESEPVLVIESQTVTIISDAPELDQIEPQIAPEILPERAIDTGLEFDPVWASSDPASSIAVPAVETGLGAFDSVERFEPEPVKFDAPRSVFGSWDASVIDTPTEALPAEATSGLIHQELQVQDSTSQVLGTDHFEPVVSITELSDFAPATAPEADPVMASVLRSFDHAPQTETPQSILETTESAATEPEAEFGVDFDQEPEPSEFAESVSPRTDAEVFASQAHEEAEIVQHAETRVANLEPEYELEVAPAPETEVAHERAIKAEMAQPMAHALESEPELSAHEADQPITVEPEAALQPEASERDEPAEAATEIGAAHGHPHETAPELEPQIAEVHHEPALEPVLEPMDTVTGASAEEESEHAEAVPTQVNEEHPEVDTVVEAEIEPAALELEPAMSETAPSESALSEPAISEVVLSEVALSEPTMPEAPASEPEVVLEPEAIEATTEAEPSLEPEMLTPEPAMAEANEAEPEAVLTPAEDHPESAATAIEEPESETALTHVEPAPIIEPDRGAWYAPSSAFAQPVNPTTAHHEPPTAPSYITANSGFALREETQVENEIVEHTDAPIPTPQPATNGEEGIVWLASARRDASSRNADRLRKDPMALKPGRLESEHGLAEAEAHVLEAKLHAACDGAGLQHRRLEAEFALKVAQAAVELASKRVEAVSLRERYGAASKAELEHAQLELERAQEELALAKLSEGVVQNVPVNGEPNVNRVEVDAERLKVALQSTPQMLSARHTLERAELELAIRDNPAYPASEIASVRNVVNQAREHFSTLEATLHAELEAAMASMRYYGARMGEKDSAWKTAESELHHAEEGVRQGFVASLTRDEAQLKALRADMEKRKASHKYLEAVHRLQCLTHQYMLG